MEHCGSNVFSGVKYLYFFFDCIGNIIFVFVVGTVLEFFALVLLERYSCLFC